ncbi:MAG: membrane protein insertion efficiency factor YidD [candidate division Zixibacteria bacterium]
MKSQVDSPNFVNAPNRASFLAALLIGIIYIYRYTLSPLLEGSCRFYPTCSHYGEEALRKHGAWRGSMMVVARIFRCHPWHEGGYDPVK